MLSGRGSRPYWGVLLPLPAAPPPPSSTVFYISAVFFMSDLYNTDCLCTLICTMRSAYFYCILPAGCLFLLSCAMLTIFLLLHSTFYYTGHLLLLHFSDWPSSPTLLCMLCFPVFIFCILGSALSLLLFFFYCKTDVHSSLRCIFCTNSALF